MNFRTTFTLTFTAVAVFMFLQWKSDPYSTLLPVGSTDLTPVREALAKLPPDERELVEAYVKRSRGDVLPAQFADPDAPLTARTFREAIELQRAWVARMKVVEADREKLNAQREARLAPLRALVQASVVEAEIVTRNEYQARKNPDFNKRPYKVDNSPAFIILIRVQNLGDEPIVALRGSLQAHDSQAYLPMDICWIDIGSGREIQPGGYLELPCGHDYRGASEQNKAFVNNPEGRFRVVWEPRYVKFADGRELDSGL